MEDNSRQKLLSGVRAAGHFLFVLKFIIAAVVISFVVRIFVAQPFLVTGASMEPTLMPNEYIVIDKLSYKTHPPERGDVIIMEYPLDPSTYFVKRIIGLPGEVVDISNGEITILEPDGNTFALHEPYLVTLATTSNSTVNLAENEYFVMGDNRGQSSDSREWGPLQARYIIGRAFARLSPSEKIGLLPGQSRFPQE